jgi:hypothetical protein
LKVSFGCKGRIVEEHYGDMDIDNKLELKEFK